MPFGKRSTKGSKRHTLNMWSAATWLLGASDKTSCGRALATWRSSCFEGWELMSVTGSARVSISCHVKQWTVFGTIWYDWSVIFLVVSQVVDTISGMKTWQCLQSLAIAAGGGGTRGAPLAVSCFIVLSPCPWEACAPTVEHPTCVFGRLVFFGCCPVAFAKPVRLLWNALGASLAVSFFVVLPRAPLWNARAPLVAVLTFHYKLCRSLWVFAVFWIPVAIPDSIGESSCLIWTWWCISLC